MVEGIINRVVRRFEIVILDKRIDMVVGGFCSLIMWSRIKFFSRVVINVIEYMIVRFICRILLMLYLY